MTGSLGIMQGRLSPPINKQIQAFPLKSWRDEFPLCRDLGLSCIEWIFDRQGVKQNPLLHDPGIREMRQLSERYEVRINSVVADYFMEVKLFGTDVEQIQAHVRVALNEGATPQEILEAMEAVIMPMGALAFRRGLQAWAIETGFQPVEFEE